jgi:RND family efflux transporter MFP subunit
MIRRVDIMSTARFVLPLLIAVASAQAPVETTRVVSRSVERHVKLPGEFLAYLAVPIHAKVTGFVDTMEVDRGSEVKKGELLARLVAPEMQAQVAEAQSKVQAVELQRNEAEAKLASEQSTYERLKAASATPGVVAENDVIVAQKSADAAQALVRSYEGSIKAAQASVQALKDLEQYLTINAPFDGVIVERDVHPGALVGPNLDSPPLLRLQQVTRLRLVVAVPEAEVGGIVKGARVPFSVPAYPGETFYGTVSRIAYALDEKTRSMSVELDVSNPGKRLAPGMYPEVQWPVRTPNASLLVPPTAIVTTTERTFVIRIRSGVAEWVNITRGAPVGDLVEVHGPLAKDDVIIRRATDEIREGMHVTVGAPRGKSGTP